MYNYKALDIAKYVVTYCFKKEHPVSNLQLQKILYYIQGYSFAARDKEACGEEILAWQYGPVVREVYDFFSMYAAMPIENSYSVEIRDREFEQMIQVITLNKIMQPVWKVVEQTHREAPWKYTTELFGMGSVIPKEYIRRYFKEKYGNI